MNLSKYLGLYPNISHARSDNRLLTLHLSYFIVFFDLTNQQIKNIGLDCDIHLLILTF